ncbi:putative baseplate protein [Erwinia phage Fifi44]|uniref:Baseplate protein n=1 Tax=Erwinia phage Fifi44 TaxID=2876597 RepID=A0AAE9C0H1_9CAUD|nr:putative baseplate protein [Erwinia phage Fifi44]QQV88374.1 putative baseplate protein [Erwinia phage pEa_SNUABM_27]UCR74940.1 putative baseplate protein [Erwinia phage Fifi44]UCR80827.1 putative baseplate protein [Erwinia phage Fifi451]WJN63705.1 structural protein [Erwinia phage Aioli]
MAEVKHGMDLLLSQYKNSPNLKKYIQCFLDELDVVSSAMSDSVKYRYLADSFGVMVDDIAYIVGASRTLYGAAALGFFGYYENPAAESTGDDNNPLVGGILRSDSDRSSGDFVRTDAQLKNAIRARIVKIVSNCCIEDLIVFCDLVLGRELDMEIVEGPLKLEFKVHETLPTADRVLLSFMIPDIKPAGITAKLEDDSGNIALVYYSKDYPARVI